MSARCEIPLQSIHKCCESCSTSLDIKEDGHVNYVPNPTYNKETGRCSEYGQVKTTCVFVSEPDGMSHVLNLDEVVIADKSVKVEINYPLRKPFKFPITCQRSGSGITRRQLIDNICKIYKKIYSEEEKTTKTTIGSHHIFKLNRNETDGKYGIWGHHIEDLAIEKITYYPDIKLVGLSIGS